MDRRSDGDGRNPDLYVRIVEKMRSVEAERRTPDRRQHEDEESRTPNARQEK
jgi:hypothetical protein